MTITFACEYDAMHEAEKLAQSFHQAHPGINVRVISTEVLGIDLGDPWPKDSITRLASAADVVDQWFRPTDTQSGLIMDLQPFIEADRSFQPEDFYPGTLESFRWDGGTWALPTGVEARLIFYNKDLFDQAGVPYPQAGWTLNDFLDKADRLTVRHDDEETQWGFADVSPNVLTFVLLQGAKLVDDTTRPLTPSLDTPEVAQALRWYTDLILVHGVAPTYPRTVDDRAYLEEMRHLRDEGKVAMWTDLSINREYRSETINLGIVPFPAGKVKLNPVMTAGYWMSAGTPHPQECWEWLKFLSGQFSPVEGLPPRRSLAESAAFRAQVGEETARVYLTSLESSDTLAAPLYNQLSWLHRTLYWFYRACDAVMDGADAAQALGEAQHKAETYVRCLEVGGGFDDAQAAEACAREVDPDFQEQGP